MLLRLRAEEQEARFSLSLNACDEVGRALNVERHDDDAAERAREEGRDPLGAVPGPEHDALALLNAARVEFAREAEGGLGHAPVRPSLVPQSAPGREGGLRAALQIIVEVAVGRRTHKPFAL